MLSKTQPLPLNSVETSIVPDRCQENEKKRAISKFLPSLPIINTKASTLFQIRHDDSMKKRALRTQADEHGQVIKNALQRRSRAVQESDQVKVARKYFGKKIVVLKTSNDAARLYQKSKYLTKIAVGCGTPQTFGFPTPKPPSTTVCKFMVMNDYFRSKGSSILLDKDIHVAKDCQYKLLPIYYRTADQSTTLNLNWSWFKKMSSIKQVHLCLKSSKHYHVKTTVDNKSIKTFKLSCKYGDASPDADSDFMQSFILQLPRQSSLPKVDVDLTSFAKDVKVKFLTLLLESNIARWHIKDSLEDAEKLYAEKCTKMLNETDFIYFLTNDSNSRHPVQNHLDQNQMFSSKRIADLQAKSRKGLTFVHNENTNQNRNFGRGPMFGNRVNNEAELTIKGLTSLLYYCQSLKSLCLDWSGKLSESMSDENVKFIESLKNINNVIIRPFNHYGQNQGCVIIDNPQFRYISLVDTGKDQNSDLEYLELVDCRNLLPNYSKDNFIARYLKNTHNSLDKISTLKHLNISFDTEFDQQIVHNLFNSLQGLQKLNMRVVARTNHAWDEAFPFARLNHLREFRLTVDSGHSERGNQYHLQEPKWGLQLAKSLSQMRVLETFELQDQNDRYMKFPVFFGLLKSCCQLTRLKHLVIHTQTVKENDICEDDIMPSTWNENVRQRRKILEGILEELLQMIKTSNPALEIINIVGLHMYETKIISYVKDEQNKMHQIRRQDCSNLNQQELCYDLRRQGRFFN